MRKVDIFEFTTNLGLTKKPDETEPSLDQENIYAEKFVGFFAQFFPM